MSKDEEIQSIRTEEERRGKRPINLAEKRRGLLLRKKLDEVVRSGNKEQFEDMITHDLGQTPGSPAYIRSWKAWKEYHGEE